MNHEPREPFVYANPAKRFPTAIVLSLAVNLLFLTGAATVLRARAVPASPSGETGYITVERVEARTVHRPRPPERNDSLKESVPPLSLIRGTISVPTLKHTRGGVPQPVLSPTPPTQPDTVRRPLAVTNEAQEATNEPVLPFPSPDAVTDSASTDVAGADVAASNAFPGDSSAPPSDSGGGVIPAPGVITASPQASPATGPAAVPTGVTRNAELAHQELPRLPDALRESGYRSFVRVEVEVLANGNFTVAIRTSSGNPDIDARVLEALKRWKWKPALENGVPVTSTQSFRFDFDVD